MCYEGKVYKWFVLYWDFRAHVDYASALSIVNVTARSLGFALLLSPAILFDQSWKTEREDDRKREGGKGIDKYAAKTRQMDFSH